MDDKIRSLKGERHCFDDSGRVGAKIVRTSEFSLRKGVVILEIDTDADYFDLKFVRHGATVPARKEIVPGGGIIGRVIDFARTVRESGSVVEAVVVGSSMGARVVRDTFLDVVGNRGSWTLKASGVSIKSVGPDGPESMSEGRYRLEVASPSRWQCQITQPDLEQSIGPFIEAFRDQYSGSEGSVVIGPYDSGSRPILANIRHLGGGGFLIDALSVDGTHRCRLYESSEGQFSVEDHRTEIKPGKEYMLNIIADGNWRLNLREGY